MSIARLISSDIVTQQRIFGVSVYILISFLLCTIAEQKFLSSCFRWSSQLNDEPLFTTALRETRMNADRYKRGIKDDIFYHNNEENIGGVAPRPRSEATRRNDNVNTTTATTSSTIIGKGNDARWRRRGVSDDDQPQYHEISPLLSCFNITLTDVGIHPQDHIRVFFSENSMCNDAPPDDLKIVRSPTATSIDTFSSRNLSSIGAVNANKSSSSTTPKHQQRFLRHQNVTSSQRIAIAIMVPHGQCSLEQKLQHIVKWYQNDHPDVKVVMFYDPPSLPHLVSSASSNTPSSRPTTVVLDDDTVTASKRNNQRNPPSFSSYTSEHSSSTYINTDLSSARGSAIIVPFNISQRTATSFKNMINDANQFVDVRIVFPYYAASIVTNSRTTERNLSERLSFKERILALIEDIFASMIVTILSLVVTGILLLLCWKDALSIEITADGVLIISNVSYVDDSSHNMMEDQQRATLSTELVLAFPEVTFASHSGRINQASRRMPPSPRTSQQRQQRHFDEESPLPLLPAGGGAEQVKSEQIKFPAEKLPCFCCNTTCSICLEDFTPDETLRLLPCGHIFHTSCILPWLTKRATSCPLCKQCLHCDDDSSGHTSTR